MDIRPIVKYFPVGDIYITREDKLLRTIDVVDDKVRYHPPTPKSTSGILNGPSARNAAATFQSV